MLDVFAVGQLPLQLTSAERFDEPEVAGPQLAARPEHVVDRSAGRVRERAALHGDGAHEAVQVGRGIVALPAAGNRDRRGRPGRGERRRRVRGRLSGRERHGRLVGQEVRLRATKRILRVPRG